MLQGFTSLHNASRPVRVCAPAPATPSASHSLHLRFGRLGLSLSCAAIRLRHIYTKRPLYIYIAASCIAQTPRPLRNTHDLKTSSKSRHGDRTPRRHTISPLHLRRQHRHRYRHRHRQVVKRTAIPPRSPRQPSERDSELIRNLRKRPPAYEGCFPCRVWAQQRQRVWALLVTCGPN